MDGLIAFALTALWAVAPNGFVLAPALDPPEVRGQLPVEGFLELLPRLWVVYHEDGDQMMALYASAEESEDAVASSWASGLRMRLALARGRPRRLLPGLRVPRIFLYAPYYMPGERPRTALEMPLDVAQYFASTLLEAALDLEPPAGLARRAEQYGAELPASQRLDAYVSALSQFGADAFSVATELYRSLARQRGAGKDPCLVVDRPGTLFHQWGRIFSSVEYRGLYRPEGGRPGDWIPGPPLSPADKRYLVDELFAGFWSGDVRRDFALDCP